MKFSLFLRQINTKEKMLGFDYGYWEVAIEKHGRIKLPTMLLKSLAEDDRKSFVVTPGFGNHIALWTMKAYQKQIDYLNSLDRNIIAIKKYRNAFLTRNTFVECDSQDRLVIPKPFMELYHIDREVVLVLDNGKIELWNSEEYHKEFDMTPEELDELNEAIHLGQYNTARKEETNELP